MNAKISIDKFKRLKIQKRRCLLARRSQPRFHAEISTGDVVTKTGRQLYKEVAIAAFQGLLSNCVLVEKMQNEDLTAIAKDEDFDPWQNRISDLAIECADSLLRRLVE